MFFLFYRQIPKVILYIIILNNNKTLSCAKVSYMRAIIYPLEYYSVYSLYILIFGYSFKFFNYDISVKTVMSIINLFFALLNRIIILIVTDMLWLIIINYL